MTPEAMAALHAASIRTPAPWSVATFAAMQADPNTLIIESTGGLAIGRSAGPEAEVLTIAVHPDHRNAGLGGELLNRLLRALAARGAAQVFLEVATDNRAAMQLYVKTGFIVVGNRPRYFRTPEGSKIDAHVMRLNLPEKPDA